MAGKRRTVRGHLRPVPAAATSECARDQGRYPHQMPLARALLEALPPPVSQHVRAVKSVVTDELNHGHRRRLLRNYLAWHLYHSPTGHPFIATLPNGTRTIVFPDSDSGVANVWSRNVEQRELNFIRSLLEPGDRFVDVGCNVGNRTLALSDLLGGALLIDANPTCIERARANLVFNELDLSRFRLVCKAAGDRTGVVQFSDIGGSDTHNAILDSADGRTEASSTARVVPLTTIDREVDDLGWTDVAFVKTDAEGHDLEVLLGARQTLTERGARGVMFERWRVTPLDDFRQLLAEIGWTMFALDGSGRPTLDEHRIEGAANLFGMPRERARLYVPVS